MAYAGIAILVGVVVLVFGMSGRLWDFPSFLMVTLGTVSMCLFAFGGGVRSVTRAFSATPDVQELRTAIAVLMTARSFAVATGIAGTLVGLVIMLSRMDDPSKFGRGLSIAMLTQIYGILIAFGILTPLVGALRRKQSRSGMAP